MDFTEIYKITYNSKKYYIHKHILQQYHYFDMLLSENFKDNDLRSNKKHNIKLNCDINFNSIIAFFYNGVFCLNVDVISFDLFLQIYNILSFFQPKDTKVLDTLIWYYHYHQNYINKVNIDIIKKSNINNNHKIMLVSEYINKTNKYNLDIKWHLYAYQIFDIKDIEYPNIKEFFCTYDILIRDYKIELVKLENILPELNYRLKVEIDGKEIKSIDIYLFYNNMKLDITKYLSEYLAKSLIQGI